MAQFNSSYLSILVILIILAVIAIVIWCVYMIKSFTAMDDVKIQHGPTRPPYRDGTIFTDTTSSCDVSEVSIFSTRRAKNTARGLNNNQVSVIGTRRPARREINSKYCFGF